MTNGRAPALDFYLGLDTRDRQKVLALFQRLADFGLIFDPEKFKRLGPKAQGQGRHLWEFKSSKQLRFLGDFRPGYRFVVAHGLRKKSPRLDPTDIEFAVRVLREHDAREVRHD